MKVLIAALLSATLLLSISPAFALPPGNYLDSCKKCEINHGNLFCKCKDRNQQWQSAYLYRAHSCRSIENNNGQLRCRANRLPRGNYVDSCNACFYDGSRLTCSCQDMNSQYQQSELKHASHCRRNITNQNGYLVCGSHGNNALPAGSYKDTCRHCRYNGKSLVCQCLDRKQFLQTTRLRHAANCGFIKNKNGTLICKE